MLREIESLLRSEIEGALAEGWQLGQGGFGWREIDGKWCCAIGALGRYEEALARGADIAAGHGIDYSPVAAGFDGRSPPAERDLWEIGARLRADYLDEIRAWSRRP